MKDIMRTTVTLNEKLVRELVEISDAKTKTAAVVFAIKEQIRKIKLKKLGDLLGKVNIDEAVMNEGYKADVMSAQWLEEMGKGNKE